MHVVTRLIFGYQLNLTQPTLGQLYLQPLLLGIRGTWARLVQVALEPIYTQGIPSTMAPAPEQAPHAFSKALLCKA